MLIWELQMRLPQLEDLFFLFFELFIGIFIV